MLSNVGKTSGDDILTFDHMSGSGLLLRDPSINPPQVRSMLDRIGNEPVTSLQLVRTPLADSTKFMVNIVSFGQLEEKLKQTNIDRLFHLSLFINGKYTLEKNEVISLKSGNPVSKKSETLVIPVTRDDLTIGDMLKNTQAKMGSNYGSYDAVTNNCSVFVSNVLSANGLLNGNATVFLSQQIPELFEKFPSLTRYITKFATDTAAVVNRQLYGEGKK